MKPGWILQFLVLFSILYSVLIRIYSKPKPYITLDFSNLETKQNKIEDICISLASSLTLEEYTIFLQSYREVSKNSRLILFVGKELSKEQVDIFTKYNVETYPFETTGEYNALSQRFLTYKEFFDRNGLNDKSRVITVDVKDSFFQRDPFEIFPENVQGLWATLEGTKQIKDCGFNRNHFLKCYNEDVYNRVKDHIISCAGVTLGTGDAFRKYLHIMVNEIKERQCHRRGVDQAFHQYLLFLGDFPNLYFLNAEDGHVANLHWLPREETPLLNGKIVYNPNNKVFAIVHHYNRRQHLIQFLKKKYPVTI